MNRRIVLFSFVALLGAAAAGEARAAVLRWGSAPVDARTVDGCFLVAEQIMARSGFGDVRKAGAEVTGRRGGAYMAVTCLPTPRRPTAVVMVVGDDDGRATQARDDVTARLKQFRGDPRDPL
jgi:hypothetical protein